MSRTISSRLKRRSPFLASALVVSALVWSGLALGAEGDRSQSSATVCPPSSQGLAGVYHPGRLRVLNACTAAAGRIALVKPETDGDVHLPVNLQPNERHLLDTGNVAKLGGDLVVELMPLDAGHISEPHVGDQVRLVGAWTHDGWHDWNELHPVWAMSIDGARSQVSGPQSGGAPASASPYSAASACRTATGEQCRGYTSRSAGTSL